MPQQPQGLPTLDELVPFGRPGGGAPPPPAGGGLGLGMPPPEQLVARPSGAGEEPSALRRMAEGYLTGKGLMPSQLAQGATGILDLFTQHPDKIPDVAWNAIFEPAFRNLPRAWNAWQEGQRDPRHALYLGGITPKTGEALLESLPLYGPGFEEARTRYESGDQLGGGAQWAGNFGSLPKIGRLVEQGALSGARQITRPVPLVGPAVSAVTQPLDTATRVANSLMRGTRDTLGAARTALENRLLFRPGGAVAKGESKIQDLTQRAMGATNAPPGFGERVRSYFPEFMGGEPVTPQRGMQPPKPKNAPSSAPWVPAEVQKRNLYTGEASQKLQTELAPDEFKAANRAWGQTKYRYGKPGTPEDLVQQQANMLQRAREAEKSGASKMFNALSQDWRTETGRVFPRTEPYLKPIGPLSEAIELARGAPNTPFYPSASKYATAGRLALYGGLPLTQTFFSGAKKIDDNLIRAIVLSKLMENQPAPAGR
jgi:hypothetical protein